MSQPRSLPNYLRTYRKKTGLSQREMGILVGYKSGHQISRHERFSSRPPLASAIAFEVIFQTPIAELFPGVHGRIKKEVERRLDSLKKQLGDKSGRGRNAVTTARKLEWIAVYHELH